LLDVIDSGIDGLPNEILLLIFHYVDLKTLAEICSVSKRWRSISEDNSLWKEIATEQWSAIGVMSAAYEHITNWKAFFKRRWVKKLEYAKSSPFLYAIPGQRVIEDIFIDNCLEWEFKCPLKYEDLDPSINQLDGTMERYCKVCNKSVYKVTNKEDLLTRVQNKQCVNIDLNYFNVPYPPSLDIPPLEPQIMGGIRYDYDKFVPVLNLDSTVLDPSFSSDT